MKRWGTVAVAIAAAVGAGLPTDSHAAPRPVTEAAAARCPAWTMHTVASGLGILESLLPDGHGHMLLSSSTNDEVERLSPNGAVTKVISAPSPGQLVWHGRHSVFVPTGDAAASGTAGKTDGTLQVLNLRTKKLSPYAAKLTMPNGLAIAANGNAFVTRDVGVGTGITRIAAAGHHKVKTRWANVSDTNGIAINRKNTRMYVDQTFTSNAPILAISMRHPHHSKQIGDLAGLGSSLPKGLDDLIMGPGGVLYLPANLAGEVFSFDPKTKRACLIATGLTNPSAVAVGTGHGWKKGSLFVCGFDGTVRELDPATR